MSGTTTDPNDPGVKRGAPDEAPVPMSDKYLVLSDDEIAKGYLRPLRRSYKHLECGSITTMGEKIAATYARDPWFYGSTYCVNCSMHRPLSEFLWVDLTQSQESMSPHMWPSEITDAVVAARAGDRQ